MCGSLDYHGYLLTWFLAYRHWSIWILRLRTYLFYPPQPLPHSHTFILKANSYIYIIYPDAFRSFWKANTILVYLMSQPASCIDSSSFDYYIIYICSICSISCICISYTSISYTYIWYIWVYMCILSISLSYTSISYTYIWYICRPILEETER